MLLQMQIDMLEAATKVAGRIQQIFEAAIVMQDEDTFEYIADNYKQHLTAKTIAMLDAYDAQYSTKH